MKWAQTLWDLLGSGNKDGSRGVVLSSVKNRARDPQTAHASRNTRPARNLSRDEPSATSMQSRYDTMAREMLTKHHVRVRRWRTSMSGVAWEVRYRDGTVSRLIDAPRPKGPMSAAVFLHEIGHHAIGLGVYRPRCLEEYHAWAFALQHMELLGLNVTDAVRRRMHESLRYAINKARRRGIQQLPAELAPFVAPWPGPKTVGRRATTARRLTPRRGADARQARPNR
jgi:hypothetical protein